SKSERTSKKKTQNLKQNDGTFEFRTSYFGFLSDFEFRISDSVWYVASRICSSLDAMVPSGAAGANCAGSVERARAAEGAGAIGRSGSGGDATGIAPRLATAERIVFAAGVLGARSRHGRAAMGTRLEPVGRAGTRSCRRHRLQPQHV